MFTSDQVVLGDLRDVLQAASLPALADHWSGISARCHARAYRMIVSALVARGYLKEQIDDWDAGADFERQLTLTLTLKENRSLAAALDRDAAEELKELREELKCVLLAEDGVAQSPEGTAGLPAAGPFDTTGDLFSLDPDDDRIGEPTQF